MRLSKKNRSNGSLNGATFTVERTNKNKTVTVSSTSDDYVNVIGLDKNGEKDIVINDDTTVDKYIITEKDAPDGYKINTNKLYLEVTRKIENNAYKIYHVKLKTDKDNT